MNSVVNFSIWLLHSSGVCVMAVAVIVLGGSNSMVIDSFMSCRSAYGCRSISLYFYSSLYNLFESLVT